MYFELPLQTVVLFYFTETQTTTSMDWPDKNQEKVLVWITINISSEHSDFDEDGNLKGNF